MAFYVLLVVCLAVYRLTRLLVTDAFPPIAALRAWPARRFGEDSSWAYLAECPWCASVYVSALVVGAVDGLTSTSVPLPVLVALVASGVTGLVSSVEP